MNSNEKKPLLPITNTPQTIIKKEVIIVNNDVASAYYCFRIIALIIILIGFIVGIVLIVEKNN